MVRSSKQPPKSLPAKRVAKQKAARKAAKPVGRVTWDRLKALRDKQVECEQELSEATAEKKRVEEALTVKGCDRKGLALKYLNAHEAVKAARRAVREIDAQIHELIDTGTPLFDQEDTAKVTTTAKTEKFDRSTGELLKAGA